MKPSFSTLLVAAVLATLFSFMATDLSAQFPTGGGGSQLTIQNGSKTAITVWLFHPSTGQSQELTTVRSGGLGKTPVYQGMVISFVRPDGSKAGTYTATAAAKQTHFVGDSSAAVPQAPQPGGASTTQLTVQNGSKSAITVWMFHPSTGQSQKFRTVRPGGLLPMPAYQGLVLSFVRADGSKAGTYTATAAAKQTHFIGNAPQPTVPQTPQTPQTPPPTFPQTAPQVVPQPGIAAASQLTIQNGSKTAIAVWLFHPTTGQSQQLPSVPSGGLSQAGVYQGLVVSFVRPDGSRAGSYTATAAPSQTHFVGDTAVAQTTPGVTNTPAVPGRGTTGTAGGTGANFRQNPALTRSLNTNRPDIASVQLAIALVTNETRARNGKQALTMSAPLGQAAQMHADDMAKGKFFSHNNPRNASRLTPESRARLAGITNPSIAENINQDFGIRYQPGTQVRPGPPGVLFDLSGKAIPPHSPLSLADSLVASWMNSPGHRANILSDQALEIGVGVSFFPDPGFNQVASVRAVQKFQLFRRVRTR